MLVGLRAHDIADSFDEMCLKAQQNGICNIQFALAKTCSQVNFDEIGYDEEFAENIKQKLEAHNIHISVLGCYINPVHPDKIVRAAQLKRFEEFIRYAKHLNARVIGTETGSCGNLEDTLSEENYQRFVSDFRPLVKCAEDAGVMIAIEPVWFFTINSVKKMKRFIDDIASENLGVIFDICNLINTENYLNQKDMIDEAFDLLGDKIQAVHLKDYVIEENRVKLVPVGEGNINYGHIFERINELKAKPDIILDELPLRLYAQSLNKISQYIK